MFAHWPVQRQIVKDPNSAALPLLDGVYKEDAGFTDKLPPQVGEVDAWSDLCQLHRLADSFSIRELVSPGCPAPNNLTIESCGAKKQIKRRVLGPHNPWVFVPYASTAVGN